jgi:hypothetical protein
MSGGTTPLDPPILGGSLSPQTPSARPIRYWYQAQLTPQVNSHKLNAAPCPRAFRRDHVASHHVIGQAVL